MLNTNIEFEILWDYIFDFYFPKTEIPITVRVKLKSLLILGPLFILCKRNTEIRKLILQRSTVNKYNILKNQNFLFETSATNGWELFSALLNIRLGTHLEILEFLSFLCYRSMASLNNNTQKIN